MNKMFERLCVAAWRASPGPMGVVTIQDMPSIVRAVLQTLREPSPDMLKAGHEEGLQVLQRVSGLTEAGSAPICINDAPSIFTAQIDAVLK